MIDKTERIRLKRDGGEAQKAGEGSNGYPYDTFSEEAHYWLIGWWKAEYEEADAEGRIASGEAKQL